MSSEYYKKLIYQMLKRIDDVDTLRKIYTFIKALTE